ncbi:MAG: TonB-dependent receptor [Gammaproteobacteria bacterium]|nr:TonB-dependent receptor [Gammaproteobacteria bacterium]
MTPMVEPIRGRSLVNALAGLPRQTVLVDVSAPRAVRRSVIGGSWRGLRWVLAACALPVALFAHGDAEGRRHDIDIREADAPAALRKLAEQTESLLLFPFELAEDRRANRVVGRYTIEEALARLLDGSGLVGVLTNQRVISIVRVEPTVERGEPMTATTETNVLPVPSRTPLLRRIGATVAAVLAAPGVFAGESGDAGSGEQPIEVIVVTAEKREENLLDVPVTMTAFSNQMIEELGMTSHDDLEQLVPGLQFQDEGTQTGQGTTIRGIGTRLAGETVSDLAVATYVDGVYTLGLYGVAPNMFDLERVEVARGPQGTLHGRNSIAGAISYFSKRPTDHWDLLVHTEFTDQFTQRYGVAFGGPISENALFRINGSYYQGDGAQENIGFGNDYDAPDQTFLAPQLRFKTDRMDLNLRYTSLNDDGSPRTQVLLENVDRSIPQSRNPNPAQSLNAFYLWDGSIPSVPADCPPGRPAWECGDVKNVLNVNRNSVGSSTAEQTTIAFSFELNDNYTLRYNFGDTDNFSDVQVDQDQTNRVASADDPLRAADADVPLVDEEKHVLYDYTERSHEIQLVSNLDGQFNFIVGAFTYENTSAWFVPFYVHTSRG